MEMEQLTSIVESVLFASDKPINLERFLDVFEEDVPSKPDIEEAINRLKDRYSSEDCGFQLREAHGGYQITTKKENATWVRKFLESKPFRLSRTALETLSIIAYRQPITRAEVDKIRGIDSSHIVRVLIEKDIVKMAGKADVPGRPVQYGTTPKFLELMGLPNLNALPPLSELKELQGDTPPAQDPLEKGLEKFIDSQVSHDEKYAEIDEGLEEIDGMIQTAADQGKEVYESEDHKLITEENIAAVKQFQLFSKDWKKKLQKRLEDKVIEQEADQEEPMAAQDASETDRELEELDPESLEPGLIENKLSPEESSELPN